jgi:hypothetical protein
MYRFSAAMLLCAIALALTACGGGPQFAAGGRPLPTPEEPGLYVLTPGDELARVDGSPEWERKTWAARSDFAPGVEFILYEPALAGPPGQAVSLWRVAWLRSELEPTGQAAPVSGSQWVVAHLDSLSVPLAATPHPEIPGIVHYGPAERLGPGLYELQVSPPGVPSRQARIGVMWSSLDKRGYAAAHCVDRVLGGDAAFQPCMASHAGGTLSAAYGGPQVSQEPAGAPLRIELFDPVRENGGLRIQGTVRNASSSVQAVPLLQATVVDGAGRPLDSWVFPPPERRIAPGGQVTFTIWRPVRDDAARLDVDFVGMDQHAGVQ